jgi:methylmalonyl-CoA/ethylmalonyl-CoA epimerase
MLNAPPPFAAGALGQVALTVSDVERAKVFYRDTLGLPLLFEAGPTLAFLQAGDVRLMLTVPQGHGAVGFNSVLYFRVQGIGLTHNAILARGAAPERPPELVAQMPDYDLWMSFVRDPEGNLIGLMEEISRLQDR